MVSQLIIYIYFVLSVSVLFALFVILNVPVPVAARSKA